MVTAALAFEAMELFADTGLTLTAYSPEPNSPSADGQALLATGRLLKKGRTPTQMAPRESAAHDDS